MEDWKVVNLPTICVYDISYFVENRFIADDFLSLTSHKHNVRDNLTLESINDQLEELELWYKWKYNGHSLRFVTQGIVPHTIENSDKFEVTKDKKVKLRNKIYVSDISYDPRHYYPSRPSIFVYSVDSTGLLIPICMIRMMVKLLEMCEFAIPLLTDLDWYFIPVGNPDGYYYNTVTLPNLDGKNRERVPLRLNRNPTERNCESQYCAGVNIDRNFDFHWKSGKNCSTVGSEERARCLQENPGNQPFSERESNGFKRYLNAKENVFKVFIQLESTYPQEKPAIVFPWAYSADTPSNYNDLRNMEL
ncbi:mast cell carboxypeptidase A-like isoform X2 [Periplaneta americana]|uniref:mast cell carboxypeptidase A-like isoform X2 n=1 Tax=Periplaneta americana TaxID=6978 RepID=UPI0037E76481